jgi:hypothetical protein
MSNYAFAGLPVHLGCRVMFAIGVVPLVFIVTGVFFMPESPWWLAMRGRHGDASAVLVRTSDTLAEADLRLAQIKQAVASVLASSWWACSSPTASAGARSSSPALRASGRPRPPSP